MHVYLPNILLIHHFYLNIFYNFCKPDEEVKHNYFTRPPSAKDNGINDMQIIEN